MLEAMNILTPAQFQGYQRRKDRTVRVSFVTQEIEDISGIDQMVQDEAFGVLYFCERESGVLSEEELRAIDSADLDLERKDKSPSKRLRSVLWLNFCEAEPYFDRMTKDEKETRFRDYYKREMERIIQSYKDKLP